jgi:tetratricopeptide (TPR) repeat protein
MQNKKLTMAVMATLSVVFFGLTYFFITQKQMQNRQQAALVTENSCPYASDQEAYDQMVATENESVCACVQNENLKSACVGVASDTGFYRKALNDLNSDICGNIKDQTSKESCVLAVQSGMENAVVDPGLMPEKKPMLRVDYEKMQKENPADVANLLNLAMAYGAESFSTGDGKVDAAKINQALAVLEQAKEMEPNNSRIYAVEGYIDNLNLQSYQAIVAYTKSLELDINNSESLIGRARAYAYLEKFTEAIADLEKAAGLDRARSNNEIYLNLCNLYAQNSNREKAMENCNVIIDNDNDESLKIMARESLSILK